MANTDRTNNDRTPADATSPGRGKQGVDKAPGKETSITNEQFVPQTQKGKNKVDGDPNKESDQPLDHQDIRS
jgi:hypothetical protein